MPIYTHWRRDITCNSATFIKPKQTSEWCYEHTEDWHLSSVLSRTCIDSRKKLADSRLSSRPYDALAINSYRQDDILRAGPFGNSTKRLYIGIILDKLSNSVDKGWQTYGTRAQCGTRHSLLSQFFPDQPCQYSPIYIYICVCVCVCVCSYEGIETVHENHY
jgi:hypothetical protein